MPDMKLVVPAVAGIAVLFLLLIGVGWLFDHPIVLVAILLVIAGGFYLRGRRNRV